MEAQSIRKLTILSDLSISAGAQPANSVQIFNYSRTQGTNSSTPDRKVAPLGRMAFRFIHNLLLTQDTLNTGHDVVLLGIVGVVLRRNLQDRRNELLIIIQQISNIIGNLDTP